MVDYMRTGKLAAIVTGVAWLVSYLFGILKIGTVTNLFSTINIPAYSVVTPTLGGKILGFISGYLKFNFLSIETLAIFVSAFVGLLIGFYAVDKLKFPVFKGVLGFGQEAGKIFSVLLYGAIPIYLLFSGFVFPGWYAILGVLIWTALVSLGFTFVAKILKQ